MEASEHLRKGLELCGYTLVHTWRNGKNIDEIYERSQVFNTPDAVCIYNNGILIGVRTERATGSYLLANEILSNPDQYISIDQDVSWCCTSGVVTYYNENKEVFYTVFSAAGHGSVANEIPSDKVTPKMKEAWARRATGSYLLANEILSNPDQYIPIDQDVSWYCTSGVVTYYNENKEVFYTVFSAAGHGSVANEIPSDKVTPKMKEAWARIEQNMIENAEKAAWGSGGP